MRTGGGSVKGAAYEREVAVQLSLWLSGGAEDDWLWRSAGSGGRATRRAKRGGSGEWDEVGDLRACSPEGLQFTRLVAVECKCHKDFDLLSPVDGRSASPLAVFWALISGQAATSGRVPMLIFRRNRGRSCVALASAFVQGRDMVPVFARLSLANIQVSAEGFRVCIWPLKEFLAEVTPGEFIRGAEDCVQEKRRVSRT